MAKERQTFLIRGSSAISRLQPVTEVSRWLWPALNSLIIAKLKEMALLLPVGSSAKFDLCVSKSLTYFKGLKLKKRSQTFLLASKAEPKSPGNLTDNPPPWQLRKEEAKKKKTCPQYFLGS